MNVLVTGGAGYIGSHAALRLLELGHRVVVLDNLSKGHRHVMGVLATRGEATLVEADICDGDALERAMRDHRIEAVMHFAGLCSVPESMRMPDEYARVNVGGTERVAEAMRCCGVGAMVFSSSAAVYGQPPDDHMPIREAEPPLPINPYGRTKLEAEELLATRIGADHGATALRYFNVAGCDRLGRLGEEHEPETHLIPLVLDAALGRGRGAIEICGSDYPTPDGTCVRDYVHVEDLVEAHVLALHSIEPGQWRVYNVASERGYSVRQVVETCRGVTGLPIAALESPRRPGDPPTLLADCSKIKRELGWRPRYSALAEIVETAWRWRAGRKTAQ